jgi:hypothetical protein
MPLFWLKYITLSVMITMYIKRDSNNIYCKKKHAA